MMAYDNTNRWTLNKNDRKEKDTHPDYKGSLNVNGVDYWIDGWIKDSANGKFISGSLKPKDARGNGTPGAPAPAPTAAFDTDLDDDVPFVSADPALEYRVR
jgi:hypothetical protein